jgi:hypothetical protein
MDVIKILVEQGFKFQLIYFKKTDLKKTMIYTTLHRKLKIVQHEPH